MIIGLKIYPENKFSHFRVKGTTRKGTVVLHNSKGETFYATQKVFNALCQDPDAHCIIKKVDNAKFIGTFLTY